MGVENKGASKHDFRKIERAVKWSGFLPMLVLFKALFVGP